MVNGNIKICDDDEVGYVASSDVIPIPLAISGIEYLHLNFSNALTLFDRKNVYRVYWYDPVHTNSS